jgi:hypothetical protein
MCGAGEVVPRDAISRTSAIPACPVVSVASGVVTAPVLHNSDIDDARAYAAPTLIIRVGIVHEGRPAFLAEARTWPNKPLV